METIKSNKIGKFKFMVDIINERPQDVRAIMAECIVIGVEFFDYNGMVVYTAISERFDWLLGGDVIPFYVWELATDASGVIEISSCERMHAKPTIEGFSCF